jgi:hypothetical protein
MQRSLCCELPKWPHRLAREASHPIAGAGTATASLQPEE